jgi:manganese efflux pump family protein
VGGRYPAARSEETALAIAALITWCGTVALGLYMLTVWLIENDVTGRGSAPSQLPSPVVFTHLGLAITGLGVWVAYLLLDEDRLAWIALGTLTVIIALGLTMFARWIPVHRAVEVPTGTSPATAIPADLGRPAESNFPQAVVACHGALATATYVLVLLTALDLGGS